MADDAHDEILRSLAAMLAAQHEMNQEQRELNARQLEIN